MSENNIIKTGNATVIFNGGNPLEGCPESYTQADEWAKSKNGNREDYQDPKWSFDCGFKLDFDGPLVTVDSRFYPPKTHYGPTWDGNVHICVGEQELITKKFDCKSLDELHETVELYVSSLKSKLADFIKNLPE